MLIHSSQLPCTSATSFFNKLQFDDRDISKEPSAQAELQELGVFSTPATVIDGELVLGFNRPKLESLLGLDHDVGKGQ